MNNQKSENFVSYVISKIRHENNKGFGAKLKKSDNEATEYQSWEILARWIDLESVKERKAYGLIGASLARSNFKNDGSLSLGKALYFSFRTENETGDIVKSSAATRLRRILACKESLELIDILRPILRFFQSKEINICYSRLLNEILWFDNDYSRDKIRSRWAQDFFGKMEEENDNFNSYS